MSDTSTRASDAPQSKVVIERTYRARIEDLWELRTTKAGFELWWGPEGFRVEVHTLDARAGGTFAYDMIADAPEAIAAMKRMGQPLSHYTRGRFDEFKPLERLALIHVIDFIAGVGPYESEIEVDFHPSGDHARMVVTLHPHRDPHWTKMSVMGFQSRSLRSSTSGSADRHASPCTADWLPLIASRTAAAASSIAPEQFNQVFQAGPWAKISAQLAHVRVCSWHQFRPSVRLAREVNASA